MCLLVRTLDGPVTFPLGQKCYKISSEIDREKVIENVKNLFGSALPKMHQDLSKITERSPVIGNITHFSRLRVYPVEINRCFHRNGRKRSVRLIIDKYQYRYEDLMKKAMSAGLRARRVMMSLIETINLLLPFFHQIDLQTPSWVKSLDTFERTYTLFWFLGVATDWMKFHLAYFFSRATSQTEHPSSPFGDESSPLTGVGYVWWSKLLYEIRRGIHQQIDLPKRERLLGIANTVLQFKKALPAVNPFELIRARINYPKDLSKPNPDPRVDVSDSFTFRTVQSKDDWFKLSPEDKRKLLISEVKRTTYDLFKGANKKDISRLRIPSTSSHFDYISERMIANPSKIKTGDYPHPTKPNGGAFYNSRLIMCEDGLKLPSKSDFCGMTIQNRLGHSLRQCSSCEVCSPTQDVPGCRYLIQTNPGYRPWAECNLYVDWSQFESIFDSRWFIYDYIERMIDKAKMNVAIMDIYQRLGRDACHAWIEQNKEKISRILDVTIDELPKNHRIPVLTGMAVSPVALAEPLKVRMITKGPIYRYWVGAAVQRAMHSILRKHPIFVAIGRPLLDGDLDRLGRLGQDESYCSGDYKAATDLIDPELSKACCNAMSDCFGLSSFLKSILVQGLVGSEIATEDTLNNESLGDFVHQSWGQLMGSPLSFPVLCIINCSLNRLFLELSSSERLVDHDYLQGGTERCQLPLDNLPMLINGDDVLLRFKSSDYELWKDIVRSGGLVPSIGKNYVSRDFVVINSTVYSVTETFFGLQFNRCNYANIGLMHPQLQRGSLDDSFSLDPSVFDLGQISHEFTRGFEEVVQDRMMSLFIGDPTVRQLLSGVPPSVSYFVSKNLGGLGLKLTREGLISAEQIGYYSRVGMTHDELAPCIDGSTFGRRVGYGSFWNHIPSETVAECWMNASECCPEGPDFGSPEAWRAYLTLSKSDIIKCSASKRDAEVKREGICFQGPIPNESDIFYPIRGGYSERFLNSFPWRKFQFKVGPVDTLVLPSLYGSDLSISGIHDSFRSSRFVISGGPVQAESEEIGLSELFSTVDGLNGPMVGILHSPLSQLIGH